MSIIGTRPPLISETNLYELHHRARLQRPLELYRQCIWSKYTNESGPQSNRVYANRNSEHSR